MFLRIPFHPLFAAACLAAGLASATEAADMPAFKLVSSAFQDHAAMDKRFSCQGGDISPPLAWVGAPTGTKSFALVMDDPDAPMGTWVHWVVYGLPASVNALAEGAAKSMPTGSRDGKNSWGKAGYGGPCPPSGTHRYFHKLYALDTLLPDLHKPDKAALEAAMKGHVLAEAELVGTYQKH